MKKLIIKIYLLTLFLMPSAICEELGFDEFLADALLNSYNLKLLKINVEISDKGIKEARANYYPILNGYATIQRYNDLTNGNIPITAIGNEIFLNRSYYQDMASLGLNYKIFDFGTRKRQLDIAKTENIQKQLLLLKGEKDLKIDLVELYAQALNYYKQIGIKKYTLVLQNELYDNKKRLKKAGRVSEIDVVDDEIKIEEIKSQLNLLNINLAKKLSPKKLNARFL